jgi:hypothetical protein
VINHQLSHGVHPAASFQGSLQIEDSSFLHWAIPLFYYTIRFGSGCSIWCLRIIVGGYSIAWIEGVLITGKFNDDPFP